MPQQHAYFFSKLPYLPLGVLDKHGRPWASILVTSSSEDPSIGIYHSGPSELKVSASMRVDDPLYKSLSETDHKLFAGVGIDFENRQRNKLAGTILATKLASSGKIDLHLKSTIIWKLPKVYYCTFHEIGKKVTSYPFE